MVTVVTVVVGLLVVGGFVAVLWRIGNRPYLILDVRQTHEYRHVHWHEHRVAVEGSPSPAADMIRAGHDPSRAPEIPAGRSPHSLRSHGDPSRPSSILGSYGRPTAALDGPRPALGSAVKPERGTSDSAPETSEEDRR